MSGDEDRTVSQTFAEGQYVCSSCYFIWITIFDEEQAYLKKVLGLPTSTSVLLTEEAWFCYAVFGPLRLYSVFKIPTPHKEGLKAGFTMKALTATLHEV